MGNILDIVPMYVGSTANEEALAGCTPFNDVELETAITVLIIALF